MFTMKAEKMKVWMEKKPFLYNLWNVTSNAPKKLEIWRDFLQSTSQKLFEVLLHTPISIIIMIDSHNDCNSGYLFSTH